MAPGDRHERRQQRMRGAGASAVLADFGFSLLGTKSNLAPPQRVRQTPTPIQKTPRGNSAKRQRSASAHNSSSAKRHAKSAQRTVTPQLGKRKRSSHGEPTGRNGGVDELSPDHAETRSVEKSRRVLRPASPIVEELDDMPDELSVLGEETASVEKRTSEMVEQTPVMTPEEPHTSELDASSMTRLANKTRNISIGAHVSSARRSKSTELPPETPSLPPRRRSQVPPSPHPTPEFDTPVVSQNGAYSEDELESTPANESFSRTVPQSEPRQPVVLEEDSMEQDELSSIIQPMSGTGTPQPNSLLIATQSSEPRKRSSLPRTATPSSLGREQRQQPGIVEEDEVQATPAVTHSRRISAYNLQVEHNSIEDENVPDEISPEADRLQQYQGKALHPEAGPTHAPGTSDHYESAQEEGATPRETRLASISDHSDDYQSARNSSIVESDPAVTPKQKPPKPRSNRSPRKRQKHTGPKQAISVMRIKGSTVRGITIADTTRTALERDIDFQVDRMADKMQKATDPSRRKHIRTELNLVLAFKESLAEKLMDLQDANDTLSAAFQKRKLLHKENIQRRKEVLALQNSRFEIALEMDDEQARFNQLKDEVDARTTLSSSLFAIEEAVKRGKEAAKRLGRDNEGPQIPMSMLLRGVAGGIAGGAGTGLLESVRNFNDGLERAAGWLERRR